MIALRTPQPARHPQPRARAQRLTHLVFARPDLDAAETFLVEFGLSIVARSSTRLYARACEPSAYCYRVERAPRPAFLGLGFEVETRAELERLASLPGASPVGTAQHPGGGLCVTLRDPAGFCLEILHGQASDGALLQRAPLALNTPDNTRRVNGTQRPDVAPQPVSRLGHLVLETARFQELCAFYTSELGLIPSDVQVLPDGTPAVTFLRLDRGPTPADHHSVAIAQSFTERFGHCAFEVMDLDAVGMGQRVLQEAGYRHAWGIGRHILGSQVFDYWCDPWGDKHEHYCDGDQFTAEVPMGVHALGRKAMAQWGPPLPRSFTRVELSLANTCALLRNLATSPDLSIRTLVQLGRIFG
jgi:catechol 2,3-dioxygenase-like lactoylglutathione lyase family enzyme